MKGQIDMINGSLGNKIIKYAIPIALTGIMQQLFNACDVAIVGQFAGKEAMAAVGSNTPIIGLMVNFFIGISLGSNVIIARAIGRGDAKSVEKAVHTSLLVALISGVALTILGELLAPNVIRILGVPDEVFPYALKYLRIYLIGCTVIFLYNFQAAILRSCGNTKTPLMALLVSGIINVLLNLYFVVVLHMDVAGVAIATVTANLISSSILLVALIKTELSVRLKPGKLSIDKKTLKEILRIGVPSGVQSMLFSLANIVIQSAVNSLGTTVMAASSAAFNLEIFAYYVMNSFNQACTTFVGQNYGASKADRCVKTLKLCLVQCFFLTGISCVIILFFGKPLLGLFNSDPEVYRLGMIRLCYLFFGFLFSFIQETLSGYLRGFGYSFIPACCAVFFICGIRLLWVFFLFPKEPSFELLMQVYPISLAVTTVSVVIITMILKPSRRFINDAGKADA